MTEAKKRGRKGVLSVAIDPLLFEGGRTVREIANHLHETLVDKNGDKYPVPVLINNIRSRMFVFEDKGYVLEKTSDRKVRFVKPTTAEPVESPVA